MRIRRTLFGFGLVMLCSIGVLGSAETFTEHFDHDPQWDGHNNRTEATAKRIIEQDFGYSAAVNVGARPGAIGGLITPAGEPAYYAKEIPEATFDTPLTASGLIRVEPGPGNTLFGFFNNSTINEWRTPNSIVFRINGRGETFHAHVEYATGKWRAGAGVVGSYDAEADRLHPVEIPAGGVHKWSLTYDPTANQGAGGITATFDDYQVVCAIGEGHKADGATFNRFGFLNVVKSADSPGRLWISDVVINGEPQNFEADPQWDALRARERYESDGVRPRFNFGYSPTPHAGGQAPGEIGGLFFRGDCRYPERLAYYGARVETLNLTKPLHASGRLALHRGVSDSSTLFAFFHSEHSVFSNPSQKQALPINCLGIMVEGPSADGFYVYPVYRVHGDEEGIAQFRSAQKVYPDGASHTWSLDYTPASDNSGALITLTVDGAAIELPVSPDAIAAGADFNRFGFVTPWIDGNGQVIYFDDLTYTVRQ